MALIDELKERYDKLCKEQDEAREREEALEQQITDLANAINGIDPKFWDRELDAKVAAIEADVQASAQPDPAEGTPVPGAGEESRDHSDDASEFAEVSESKPFRVYSERGDVAGVTSFDTITQARAFANEEISLDARKIEVFSGDDRLFEWPVIEPEPLADPIWNEPEPTKPEADSIAKAHDYYDPKAVAERDRFNPFNIFKREGDQ